MLAKSKKDFRCGMVSIVGRPNVGKSTLLNQIVGEKVAIVTKVPQTTRNQVRGIYNDERGQIVFIDTPGLHFGKDRLDRFMNLSSEGTAKEVDCLIHLVDTSRQVGEEEAHVVEQLKKVNTPIILGLNKADLKRNNTPDYIALWEKAKGQSVDQMKSLTLLALSGRERINIDKLLDIIFGYLPPGPALYPDDIICDVPQRMAVSDIVREKLFRLMRDEIPHSLGVVIEQMQERRKKTMWIKALVLVERETQKEIVIGKGGHILKKAGSQARAELEELFEKKVFLEFHVRVSKNWRDNISLLQELGYTHS